jgi:hypothetical protein
MKVFVSTSWRNQTQPAVVQALRDAGHEVYDFRRAEAAYAVALGAEKGFAWSDVDDAYQSWDAAHYRDMLAEPLVEEGFARDMRALRDCDACLMLQPCGRSASLELGWAAGAGKHTLVLLADQEPELMLKMAQHFCLSIEEAIEVLARLE